MPWEKYIDNILFVVIGMNNDIDSRDENKQTPLMHAVYKNDAEMIEFAKRIMFNSSEKQRIVYRELLKNYCTPLDLDNPKALVLADNVSQLKIVISQNKSFDINKPDALGRTLIMYAHSVEMVEYLLSQGADVTLHDKFGKTALDYANDKTRGIILAQVNYLALKQNSIKNRKNK